VGGLIAGAAAAGGAGIAPGLIGGGLLGGLVGTLFDERDHRLAAPGRHERGHGTACRQPDGSRQIAK